MGPFGPACAVDQGDERPMVEGRSYALVFDFGGNRSQAYALRDWLVAHGQDVVVGRQFRHGRYFVRSRKGYNPDNADEWRKLLAQIDELTRVIDQVKRESPHLVATTVENIQPFIFDAVRIR
jgi:hypothetical protein